jgi:hypothetical protein
MKWVKVGSFFFQMERYYEQFVIYMYKISQRHKVDILILYPFPNANILRWTGPANVVPKTITPTHDTSMYVRIFTEHRYIVRYL